MLISNLAEEFIKLTYGLSPDRESSQTMFSMPMTVKNNFVKPSEKKYNWQVFGCLRQLKIVVHLINPTTFP
jgi:hypothetical protein